MRSAPVTVVAPCVVSVPPLTSRSPGSTRASSATTELLLANDPATSSRPVPLSVSPDSVWVWPDNCSTACASMSTVPVSRPPRARARVPACTSTVPVLLKVNSSVVLPALVLR
jgi:hypothetical protein